MLSFIILLTFLLSGAEAYELGWNEQRMLFTDSFGGQNGEVETNEGLEIKVTNLHDLEYYVTLYFGNQK